MFVFVDISQTNNYTVYIGYQHSKQTLFEGEIQMLDIFVNTWGNYNNCGADGGQWLTLPMEEEELKEALNAIAEKKGE